MLHFLQLIRWKNLIIISLTQSFVYFFLREEPCSFASTEAGTLLMLIFSTFLLAAAGYLINDYSDVKIDVVNKPEKVIVSRYISPRLVLSLHLVFNIIGIGIGFYLNLKLGAINLAVAYLLWRYSASYKYKLLIGNIVVSLLLALSLLVVYFPFRDILFQWLLFYSCFAFLTGLAREIIKDVEDMEGDAQYNCRTVPIVYGFFKTKMILTYLVLCMVFLLIFVISYFIYWKDLYFPLYLGFLVLLPLLNVLRLLKKADAKKDFSSLSLQMKLIMVAGILSMALRCYTEINFDF
jgi:4-hydroxybenzoate polyprenyltransferase